MKMFDSQIITAKMEVTVTGEFYDPEASEETLRFCVEQGLIEQYSDVDVKLLKTHPQWISVKDRMPDKQPCEYLVVNANNVETAICLDNRWITPRRVIKITHWMPLPEPPSDC